jgi:hypothetical protein
MSTSSPQQPASPTQPDDDTSASGPRSPDAEPTGDPVDPAVSTATPDPGQTGRDER